MENQNQNQNQNEMEFDLLQLFRHLLKRAWIIVLVMVVFAVAAYGISKKNEIPRYTASCRVFVYSQEDGIGYNDALYALYLRKDCQVILTGQNVAAEIVNNLGLNISPSAISGGIRVAAEDDTHVLELSYNLGIVLGLLGSGELSVQLAGQLPDPVSLVADHVLVDGGGSPGGDVLDTVGTGLDSVLLHLEGDDVDIGQGLGSGAEGIVVSGLQLDVLELELVEGGAVGLDLLGTVSAAGLSHILVQGLQVAVEEQLALLLTCLALQDHGLGQLLADLDDGVQAGHGILEDHGDLITADLVERLLIDLQQILTVIDDLAGLIDGITGLDAKDGLGGDGLTGAGLTDDGQSLALGQLEIDAADRLDLTVAGTERDAKIFNMQFGFHQSSTPLMEGLKASRRPLPNRLKEIISRLMKILGHSIA